MSFLCYFINTDAVMHTLVIGTVFIPRSIVASDLMFWSHVTVAEILLLIRLIHILEGP
jgi:hypothetical protein